MQINRWLSIAFLAVGVVFGAGGVIVSIAVNHFTSTDALCTSCHSMAFEAADPYFQHSAHRSNSSGVRASCGDCHIPTTNWFIETYTHVSLGMRDVFAEFTHDFSDPKVWEARRLELAQRVLAKMHAQDSVTCRGCHDASAIQPKSEAGRMAHASLRATCVDCHTNFVHPTALATIQSK